MSRSKSAGRASGLALVMIGMAFPGSVAWSQGTVRESIPGGVELRPAMPDAAARPSMSAPAASPAPMPAPAEAAKSMPSAQPAESKEKDDEPSAKAKKSKKSAPKARSMSAPYAAPAPAAGAPADGSGGDESKPGAVERVPSGPKQPQ